MPETTLRDRFRGCLIGVAIGDALGATVALMSRSDIVTAYGRSGIRELKATHGGSCQITDKTQMTLSTAEGVIRAAVRQATRGMFHLPSVVHQAYLRWLKKQGFAPAIDVNMDGWLAEIATLHSERPPCPTNIAALTSAAHLGQTATNSCRDSGSLIRVSPIGLACAEEDVYSIAADTAALTHGHPAAIGASGLLALIYKRVARGDEFAFALGSSLGDAVRNPEHRELLASIQLAWEFSLSGVPDARAVEQLSEGRGAEQAVAIGLYSVLVSRSFEEAVFLAVNHSGESDATGLIAGSLWGAKHGVASIPHAWIMKMECRKEIFDIADDLFRVAENTFDCESLDARIRYPGH